MKRGWGLALAAAGAVVLGWGGYVVGDRTGGASEPSCAEVRKTAEELFGRWSERDSSDMVGPVEVRAASDLVLRGEDCYPFATLSVVRAAVQQLDVSGDSDPMKYAAGLAACQAVVKDPATCRDEP